MMRLVEMALKNRGGCIVGGCAVWNLCHADDTALLATSPEELQHQVNELQKNSLLFGLEINSAKTCMMVIHPADIGTQSVLIDGKEVERVNKFKYLGSLVTVDSNSTTVIKASLTMQDMLLYS